MRSRPETRRSLQQAVALITLRLEANDNTNTEVNELLADIRVEGERALADLVMVLVNLSSWLLEHHLPPETDPHRLLRQIGLRFAHD